MSRNSKDRTLREGTAGNFENPSTFRRGRWFSASASSQAITSSWNAVESQSANGEASRRCSSVGTRLPGMVDDQFRFMCDSERRVVFVVSAGDRNPRFNEVGSETKYFQVRYFAGEFGELMPGKDEVRGALQNNSSVSSGEDPVNPRWSSSNTGNGPLQTTIENISTSNESRTLRSR
ncbi:hypothetical protein B0H17DRAFT_1187440 [Mycena rosella]|uniref:Uncharacterized protein n=1 Tax=Mycena rosella TaxID=1033263 RepID=A0AAD7C313_MYCRO|nr:hypothetical protein B0H17DRAFT_1187440 [Mycena rosella]